MNLDNQEGRDEMKLLLAELIEKSKALTAMLVTKEGISIAEAGDTSYLNTTALAALVAGMFSATREVARMVGEEHFSILLQQGENRHIHISLVYDSKMMVIVFEDYQRIGMVRHVARTTGAVLERALARSEKPNDTGSIATPEFKGSVLKLIDRILEDN